MLTFSSRPSTGSSPPPGAEPSYTRRRRAAGLRGAAAKSGVHGLHAYARRLCLWHAEPFEDVQRLPVRDACGGPPPAAEGRFGHPPEGFGLFVRVAYSPGEPEGGVVMIESLAVPARPAMHVRRPAQRDHLLGQVSDLLGDQSCLLMINQRLAVVFCLLVDGSDVIEHIGL